MQTNMSWLDWGIIAIYMVAVVGLGVAAGFLRRKGERGGESVRPLNPDTKGNACDQP